MDVPLGTRNHRFALIRLNLATPASTCKLLDSGNLPLLCSCLGSFLCTQSTEKCSLPLCGTLLTEQRTACTVLSWASLPQNAPALLTHTGPRILASIFCYSPSYSTVGAPILPGLELVFECVKRDQGLAGTVSCTCRLTGNSPHLPGPSHPRTSACERDPWGCLCAPRGPYQGQRAPGGLCPRPEEGVCTASVSWLPIPPARVSFTPQERSLEVGTGLSGNGNEP